MGVEAGQRDGSNAAPAAGGEERDRAQPWRDPFVRVAALVILGVLLGRALPWLFLWQLAAAVAAMMALLMLRAQRERGVAAWAAVAVVCLAGAWLVLRTQTLPTDHVSRYITDEPQIAVVTGVVDSQPRLRPAQQGPFAGFTWQPPATLLVLDLRTIRVAGVETPTSGKLIVRIDQAEHRLRRGDVIRATGWLGAIPGPRNPGEVDFRHVLADRGIAGRLTLPTRGNWMLLDASPTTPTGLLTRLRDTAAERAMVSLRLGLEARPRELSLLQALLLGHWSEELRGMQDDFRRVGLTHVLSISGAHLGILMGLVWVLARLATPHPPRAAMIVLAVLLLYLLAVPLRVPIVRAAIMAGVFCAGAAVGRRTTSMGLLSIACVVVLAWRPGDLFTPGFQLSFGIVAALLRWALPVSRWLWPEPEVRVQEKTVAEVVWRRLVDATAVSLVAFGVALPVVAYHFEVVSPAAVVLSVVALVPLTGILAVGYLKVLMGLVVPSGSLILAGPLAWLASTMIGLVEHAAAWPGSGIDLRQPPSAAWVLAALAVVVALFAGRFAGRRAPMACAGGILGVWLMLGQTPGLLQWPSSRPAVELTMLSVGHGACFIIRIHEPGLRRRSYTFVFDCGSSDYLDVGARSVVPALRRMGVRRIDAVMISHAHIDHYSGVLDLVDALPTDAVLVPPQFFADRRGQPRLAAEHLVEGLLQRQTIVEVVSAGWGRRVGDVELSLLWPPHDMVTRSVDDTSLMLSIRAAGRRLLLNGDIQDDGIRALLERGIDLRADVADLAHHGSFVRHSVEWIDAVAPTVVLQSSNHARLRSDRWAPVLAERGIQRYISATDGMVQVRIARDGTIDVETFLPRQVDSPASKGDHSPTVGAVSGSSPASIAPVPDGPAAGPGSAASSGDPSGGAASSTTISTGR
jgi:competence protein ComEC